MQNKSDESSHIFLFVSTAVIFSLCIAAGIFTAFNIDGELRGNLSEYLTSALSGKTEFKKIFFTAAASDFRYSVLIMILALGTYTSFVPALLIGFKGFSSGFSVVLASGLISAGATVAVASAVFLSCVFTVPVYTLMFLLCRNCAKKLGSHNFTAGEKCKEYAIFMLSVMIMFSVLCIADCIQAVLCPAIVGLAGF